MFLGRCETCGLFHIVLLGNDVLCYRWKSPKLLEFAVDGRGAHKGDACPKIGSKEMLRLTKWCLALLRGLRGACSFEGTYSKGMKIGQCM